MKLPTSQAARLLLIRSCGQEIDDAKAARRGGGLSDIEHGVHLVSGQVIEDDAVIRCAYGSWHGRRSSAPLSVTVAGAEGARAVGRRPSDVLHVVYPLKS